MGNNNRNHNHNYNMSVAINTFPPRRRSRVGSLVQTFVQTPISAVAHCTSATLKKTLSYPTSNYSNNSNPVVTRYDLMHGAGRPEGKELPRNRVRRTVSTA